MKRSDVEGIEYKCRFGSLMELNETTHILALCAQALKQDAAARKMSAALHEGLPFQQVSALVELDATLLEEE